MARCILRHPADSVPAAQLIPCDDRSLAAAAVALHPMVVRYDPYVALTAAVRRPLQFMQYLVTKPALLQEHVRV
jgi:hypothetical protein